MKSKIATPTPRAPHIDTLRDPEFATVDRSGTRLLIWCPRHRCGAVLHLEVGIWSMEMPISFQEFLIGLRTRDLAPADSEDLVRWRDRCMAAELPQPNAPGGTC